MRPILTRASRFLVSVVLYISAVSFLGTDIYLDFYARDYHKQYDLALASIVLLLASWLILALLVTEE